MDAGNGHVGGQATSTEVAGAQPDQPAHLQARAAVSLGTKLSAGIVAVIAAVTLTVGIGLARSSREHLVASKLAAAVAFTDLFAASIEPAVDFRDEESLRHQVEHFRDRPDAVQLVVWVPDRAAPLLQLPDRPLSVTPKRPASSAASEQTMPDRIVVTRPIDSPVGNIGAVELTFSLADENEAYAASRRRIVVGALSLGATLAAIFVVLLRWLITAPLHELTTAVKQLQSGRRVTVRIRANDEVGTLAAAFNSMAATIADRERKVAAAYAKLQEVSLTDPLTGLRNRRFFVETVRQETARSLRHHSQPADAQRRNRDVVVLLIDLDLFKRINDTRGHAAGDEVLRETGRRLLQAVRTSDFVLRWGGEEFLVIARDTERKDAAVVADRLLRAIGGAPYRLEDGTLLRVTCSIGWAPFPWCSEPSPGIDLERMIQVADRALYHSKHEGRNRATGVEAIPGHPCDLRCLPDALLGQMDGKELSLLCTMGPGNGAVG